MKYKVECFVHTKQDSAEFFTTYRVRQTQAFYTPISFWSPPPLGCYKVNYDGFFFRKLETRAWGKNQNLAFDGAINLYKNAREFLKVKELYDPFGLFSSEWTDQVTGLKNGVTIVHSYGGVCIRRVVYMFR